MMSLTQRELSAAAAKHWWLFILRGIITIIFGITAWAWPGLTLATLIWLVGFWLVFDGIVSIIGVAVTRADVERPWVHLLIGLAGIIAGMFVMAYPGFTTVWLIVTIGFFAIFTGVMEIIEAIRLRKVIENEWSMALLGALNIVFGIIMVSFPGAGALSLIWVIGIYAILIGAAEIVFGFKLRSFKG